MNQRAVRVRAYGISGMKAMKSNKDIKKDGTLKDYPLVRSFSVSHK
jgi:hypothetical protein